MEHDGQTEPYIWFSSDHHFYHKNIIEYANRPYASVDEMNEALIDNWNAVVGKNDVVYYLGDFAFANKEKSSNIFARLNGIDSTCILGNHDPSSQRMLDIGFANVGRFLSFPERKIYLCHFYDLADRTKETEKMFLNSIPPGGILLHGHRHSTPEDKIRYQDGIVKYDVGVDANKYTPVNLTTVQKEVEQFLLNGSS